MLLALTAAGKTVWNIVRIRIFIPAINAAISGPENKRWSGRRYTAVRVAAISGKRQRYGWKTS